jgi:CheY-like chemotaxis protein
LGGDLAVRSELGHGSLFEFDVAVEVVDGVEIRTEQPRRRVVGLEPEQRAADGAPFRLLVVEDVESNRRLLVNLLSDLGPLPNGFEVREASNGQKALEVWEQWEPHLIWMDMRMPVMDGYEATRRIKAAAGGHETVVIALSASAFEEDREKMLAAGCDGLVRKPFRSDEIFGALVEHLGVRFVYEETLDRPADQPAKRTTRPAEVLTLTALAALPASWVSDLRKATIRADMNRILALIDEIRGHDVALADALAHLARRFKYKKILALVEQAGGQP